ncbi:MarR family EPS-associated transcriptional regulator [Henriciella marina]|uniref:MarR family EPS-associated transcriptional regulator n=1 Tax=Henriciella marina TaxID=453851 RepID=A0ABT4LU70_9PROT|nr:MarR family EPS-associated transcriptional regulator [Henriciella marina]
MTSQRNTLREDVHFRLLRLLETNPELSQRDLAKALGVSTGGIHYVLSALIQKGLIKLGNFRAASDKRRFSYVLTPKGIAAKTDLTRRFLSRKLAEYEVLKAEIDEIGQDFSESELAAMKARHRSRNSS